MPPVGFETTVSAGERPQTYALDRAATGTGVYDIIYHVISVAAKNAIFITDKYPCPGWDSKPQSQEARGH